VKRVSSAGKDADDEKVIVESGKTFNRATTIINLTCQDDQRIPWNFKDNLRGGERETEDGLLSGAIARSLDKH